MALALQETFIGKHDDNIVMLQGKYKFHHQFGPMALKGGVCLAILQNLIHTRISLPTNLEICAVRIEGPQRTTLASLYIPPSYNREHLKQELDSVLKQLPHPFILMGDFNASNTLWGSKKIDQRGKIIQGLTEKHNLIILNNEQQTRTDQRNGTSAIDLTIVSWELASKLRMEVDEDSRGSDHFPLHIHSFNEPPKITMRRRWKYNQADWTVFENTMTSLLSPDLQHSLDDIAESIISAAENSIPLTNGEPTWKVVPWRNSETYMAVKHRRKTLRRLRRLPDNSEEKREALKQFQTARADTRKIITEAKKNSWTKFIAEINPQLNSIDLWKRINSLSGKRRTQGYSLKIGNQVIEDPSKIAEQLADHFAQTSSSVNYSNEFLQIKTLVESTARIPDSGAIHAYNNIFTINELLRAIDKANGSSAGPDNIGYPMIKHLPFHAKIALLEALNRCWTTNSFPQ